MRFSLIFFVISGFSILVSCQKEELGWNLPNDRLKNMEEKQPTINVPELIFPANDTLIFCCYLNFRWNQTLSATSYELQLSKDSSFTTEIIELSECNGGVFLFSNKNNVAKIQKNTFCINTGTTDQNGIWFWRVRAISNNTYGNWSEIRNYQYKY